MYRYSNLVVMIIYEVNLSITQGIKENFLKWLSPHIEEILQFPGFISAQTYQDLEPNTENLKLVVHYQVESLKLLNTYFLKHSEKSRQQAIDLFGNEFSASRRILKKN